MCSLLRIHLLNLRDGSPHCAAPSNNIMWAIPQSAPPITAGTFGITGSRIMACLFHSSAAGAALGSDTVRTVLVWDRKTGYLVRTLDREWLYFPEFTPSGTRAFHHELEEDEFFRGGFPRRISSCGYDPRR